jgi:hypothetical protein
VNCTAGEASTRDPGLKVGDHKRGGPEPKGLSQRAAALHLKHIRRPLSRGVDDRQVCSSHEADLACARPRSSFLQPHSLQPHTPVCSTVLGEHAWESSISACDRTCLHLLRLQLLHSSRTLMIHA